METQGVSKYTLWDLKIFNQRRGGPLGLLRGMGVMDIVLYVRLLPEGVSTNPQTSLKQASPEQPQSQPKVSPGARRKQTARAQAKPKIT